MLNLLRKSTQSIAPIFSLEQSLIRPALTIDRATLGIFGAGWLLGLTIPILLPQLPNPVKTLLLGGSVLGGVCATVQTRPVKQNEAVETVITSAQREMLGDQLAYEIEQRKAQQQMLHVNRLLHQISQAPPEQQPYWLEVYGLTGLVEQMQAAIDVEAKEIPHYLQSFEFDSPEEAIEVVSALYAATIKKHIIWTGNTGEGKTAAAHYALYQWAQADPMLVIFWFDAHLGMGRNEQFRSNWLGIPKLETMPKGVQTGAYKGEAKDLERFLGRVETLISYRKKHEINEPQVLVGIDEFTNLLGQLSEDECERISGILSVVGTEAQKYGVCLWFLLHSLTKDEVGIDRKVLRQCHIIMGVEMTQDRIQVSNSPRKISEEAIAYGQSVYRDQGGLPAGFATSLPIPNGYLPVAPVDDLRSLILEWQTIETAVVEDAPTDTASEETETPTAEPSQPETPAAPTEQPKKIKKRDLKQGNPARDMFVQMQAWYRSQPEEPSDADLIAKYAELWGNAQAFANNPKAIEYLREQLKGTQS
jgi:hypothetical protein